MTDYSTWQSEMHDDEPRDQERDLHYPYWAEVGPDTRQAPDGWSWTILTGTEGETVAGGLAPTEDAAKQAVADWEEAARKDRYVAMNAKQALRILVSSIPEEKQSEETSTAADYLFDYIEYHGDING